MSKYKCENCKKIQSCENIGYVCSKFEYPFGKIGLKPKKSKDLCSGCRNNDYNYGSLKERSIGGKGCMSYKGSSVVLKSRPHGINHSPPWPLQWQLSCYIRKW